MPKQPNPKLTSTEATHIINLTPSAFEALGRGLKLGSKRKHKQGPETYPDPKPETVADACAYAKVNISAVKELFKLRLLIEDILKLKMSATPVDKDAAMRELAAMGPKDLKAHFDAEVEAGNLTEKEADELRRLVRTYVETQPELAEPAAEAETE